MIPLSDLLKLYISILTEDDVMLVSGTFHGQEAMIVLRVVARDEENGIAGIPIGVITDESAFPYLRDSHGEPFASIIDPRNN